MILFFDKYITVKKFRHSLARGRCEPIAPFATTGALAPQRSAARPTCSDGGVWKTKKLRCIKVRELQCKYKQNKSSVTLCTPISVPPHRAPFFRVSGHKIQKPLKDFSLRGFCCRGDRIRTCDPLVPNQMRYQLRYTPNNGYFVRVTCTTQALTQHREIVSFAFSVVGVTGFEPATPWSQTRCATNCATPRNCFFFVTVHHANE